ncbi:hypothetical protein Cpir12675_001035 [Ceratocystis pirilliformis]|uniref:RNA-binding protein n=1 Tax=Ceratocystis pirilliformis TaxID=259994 RepID=A0ABR3ZI69_9PEZI
MLLYNEADSPRLKEWIVQRLGDTSDADSDILADYILALLRHEGDLASTRELCESELKDFFQDGTDQASNFVDELFRVLDYKSYLPGALPQPPVPVKNSFEEFPSSVPTQPKNHNKRKAVDNDVSGPSASKVSRVSMDNEFANPRTAMQPWTGGYPTAMPGLPTRPPIAPGVNMESIANMNMNIDLNALANMAMFNQNLLAMFTGVGGISSGLDSETGGLAKGSKKSKKKKRRCRDWERTGLCSKGDSCKFSHGDPDLPFPMVDMSALMNLAANFQPLHDTNQKAVFNSKSQAGSVSGKQNKANRIYDFEPGRVFVRDIPTENFSEDSIREFFTQFGSITDVVLQQRNNSALIQFAEESEALAAIESPKPVFENRFVTVVPARKLRKADEPAEPEFDMEEIVKKQEEAQRVFEEKKKLRDELQKQLKDLERQETTIRMDQFDLKRKIAEKQASLVRKNGGGSNSDSDMEILRAQLAALEDEAVALGITPTNGTEYENGGDETGYEFASFSRGGLNGGDFRGRSRGRGLRGRGAFRGRFRGDIHQAYKGATLDNRPKTVAIKGVDFTVSTNSEALRQYLMAVGFFTDIQSTSETTHIMFDDRRTAETFWYGLAYNPIPGVAGELELSWVSNTAVGLLVTGTEDNKNGSIGDAGDEDNQGSVGDFPLKPDTGVSNTFAKKYEDDDRADMDYDVADEDDWNSAR